MLRIRLLLLILTLFGLGQAASAHSVAETPADETAAAVVVPDRGARARTLSLVNARARLETATPNDRGQRLDEVVSVAKQRRLDLAALVDSNPGEFLRVSLPAEIRARLPAEAAPYVEQDADETGEVEVLHVDHTDPSKDYYIHTLRNARGKFSLHFAGKAPTLATGDRVRVRGIKLDNAIVLAAGGLSRSAQAVAALPRTLGAQKTLTILVTFSNAPTQPFTVAYAQNVMLNTTSSYDFEVSYQQTTLTGDVAGWFTIAESNGGCNYNNIASQAQQAAAAAGYSLASYSRFVYAFPANGCGWWGLGTVGGNPSHAWVHTRYGFSLTVVGHEMGHNLGLYHAHSLDCGDASVASAGCVASEYGDVFDIMGGAPNAAPHYNAFQKERLGWLNSGVSPPLTTVAAVPGTSNYTIAPIEDARSTTSRALKIPRSTACGASSEWFYVESRQAKGFDAFLASNASVQTGVIVHKVSEGDADSSFLLDMTPGTASWTDAALAAGQTFTDPLTGIGITPMSVGSSSSTISVTFPPAACTRATPTVTLTPSGTVFATAGASAAYAVAVRNNDSCGCGASTFDLRAAVPAGWGATTVRTASIAPAGSGSANLTVATSASAPAAFYTIPVSATNSVASTSVGSASATIAVSAAPSSTLTVSATTDKATYPVPPRNRTTNVAITTKVLSGATAVRNAAVSVRVTAPSGAVTALNGTTDNNGKSKVTYVLSSSGSPSGTYRVTSTATSGSTSSSGSTSFAVR